MIFLSILLEIMRFLINRCFTDLMSTLKIHEKTQDVHVILLSAKALARVRDRTPFDLLPFNH